MAEAVVTTAGAPARAQDRPSLWTKFAYGFGSVSFGIKDNGFNYFLLLFYSQVIGVDARLVGLAITTALVVDAILDPILGYWSDNFRSRWGRRHPFMYAAAVPVAATYFLLWNPPADWSPNMLFWYVLVLAVAIRTLIAVYEIPSQALAAELSTDYDQRSSLLSWRYYWGWTGGNTMSVLMFMALFPAFATATIKNGQFNRDAYELYGVIASVLMFIGIMVSAIGTHARIPHLPAPPPKEKKTVGMIFREIFQTLGNRSFVSLFLGYLLGAVATGLSAALAFYFMTYFWGFTSIQSGWVTVSVFASAVIGSVMAPYITRTIGKKRGAIIIGLVAFLGSPLPIVLRLLGVLPENGDPFVFWFYLSSVTIDVGLIICFQILQSSMLADLVELAELKTGRRSEGLVFATITFVRKSVQGLGVITAGFVLSAANFPTGAAPDQVSPDALWRLGAYYVPTILALWLGMVFIMMTYKLGRTDHEANLRKLAEAKGAGK
jgi:Na+/melibiose symporter-like transporter